MCDSIINCINYKVIFGYPVIFKLSLVLIQNARTKLINIVIFSTNIQTGFKYISF